MAAYRLCSVWRRSTLNFYNSGLHQFRRYESTESTKIGKSDNLVPSSSWRFLILAFGLPVGSFLFYKAVIEPGEANLSEEERKLPIITRFMIKYLMEDPVENKRKIHEHIRVCRELADKKLYVNHVKQNPIAPGNFGEVIAKEKKDVAYDTDMY